MSYLLSASQVMPALQMCGGHDVHSTGWRPFGEYDQEIKLRQEWWSTKRQTVAQLCDTSV